MKALSLKTGKSFVHNLSHDFEIDAEIIANDAVSEADNFRHSVPVIFSPGILGIQLAASLSTRERGPVVSAWTNYSGLLAESGRRPDE